MKALAHLLLLSLGFLGLAYSAAPSADRDKSTVEFDRDVRPILSQHCFKCHGPDAAEAAAGLRFDSFAGYTKTLADGRNAIVPGSPAESWLLNRVSDPDPAKRMPPNFAALPALSQSEIQTLKIWIAQGARFEPHWSFVPPVMPPLPGVSNPKWCRNPIDRFVLAKLDKEGMKPEPEADRDTLALRAAETLTGLPPTQDELNAFRKDRKAGAYERYVDRLLDKPEYGEQEARYWLDAVRYGDTHGLQLDNERGVYPYRDWVVSAFNRDLPFDKFVEWQLAGDLLPHPTTEQLVATGYVRMNLTSDEGGAIPEEFLARNTFDRVDTTATVMLGLTMGCAKCHDHKFDPIKQRDYYGMYAFFDSTQDAPLDGNITFPPPVIRASTPQQVAKLFAMAHRLDLLAGQVDPSRAAAWFETNKPPAPSTRDWQISPVYTSGSFDQAFDKPEPGEPGQPDAQWKPFKFELGKNASGIIGKDSSFVYVRGIFTFPRTTGLTLKVASDDGVRVWLNGKLIHSHKVNRGLDAPPDQVKANFHAGDNLLIAKVINGAGPDGLRIEVGGPLDERISKAVAGYRKVPNTAAARRELQDAYLLGGPDTRQADEFRKLTTARSAFENSIPMTLIAREMTSPRPTFVLKRGQYDQKGAPVTRHIPPSLGALPAGAPANRLGLAEWMVSPKNPLVARVFANRLWQQHFGIGIVKTSEDFGLQGEWPENRALLDYLAISFMRNGWSVKKLNRLIVTSAAFRQSSRISAKKLAEDPENRLISRGPRFRLDAEVIRDKALACGGLLQLELGGRGFKPYQPRGLWEAASDPASGTHFYVQDHGKAIYRRSLYLFWKRTSPPPVMTTFDAPLRDTCIVRRSRTDTPLQALTTLNETAFLEASRTLGERLAAAKGTDSGRLKAAFLITLDRQPTPTEALILDRALLRYRKQYAQDPAGAAQLIKVGEFPARQGVNPVEEASWMLVCSTLMNTDEFLTLH